MGGINAPMMVEKRIIGGLRARRAVPLRLFAVVAVFFIVQLIADAINQQIEASGAGWAIGCFGGLRYHDQDPLIREGQKWHAERSGKMSFSVFRFYGMTEH